jgi:hypothetical protein
MPGILSFSRTPPYLGRSVLPVARHPEPATSPSRASQ